MSLAPADLENALQQIRDGRLSVHDAVQWLVRRESEGQENASRDTRRHADHSGHPFPLTICDLIEKYGPPPHPIVDDWNRQWPRLAKQFIETTGLPASQLSTRQIWVDAGNHLMLAPTTPDAGETPASSPPLSPLTLANATDFRESNNELEPDDGSMPRKRLVTASACLGCIAVIIAGVVLSNRSTLDRDSQPTKIYQGTNTNIFSSASITPSQMASPNIVADSSDLAAISVDALDDSQEDSQDIIASSTALSVQASEENDVPIHAPTAPVQDLVKTPETASPPATEDQKSIASEPPRQVQASTSPNNSSVTIPAPSAGGTTTIIDDLSRDPSSLELQFPMETSLVITSDRVRDSTQWRVRDAKDQTVLGQFFVASTSDAGHKRLAYEWADTVQGRHSANDLSWGRLRLGYSDGHSQFLWLRPSIIAEPLGIDFEDHDHTSTWLIGDAPPAGLTQISLDLKTSAPIVRNWIQPLRNEPSRRGEAIVELSTKDRPSVVVRIQFEIKVGTRVELRVRHTLRWDEWSGWRPYTREGIDAAIGQIAQQTILVTQQLDTIKKRYSIAGTAERRRLATMRNEYESTLENLKQLQSRASQFQQTVGLLAQSTQAHLQVNVIWPENSGVPSQAIFEMQEAQ